MTLVVLDTETTGIETTDQVVELAVVYEPPKMDSVSWATTLICPTVPVSLEARAVHHITDEELRGAPTMVEFAAVDPWWDPTEDVLVAHNLEFDQRMMLQSGFPAGRLPARRICTWRCSLHLYPDAPSHSNQVLRYFLGVYVPQHDGPPHRALPDALVTMAVLRRMLELKTVDELVDLTQRPAILAKVPFGKSRGRPWSEMDRGFLLWVLDPRQTFNADVKATARYWYDQPRALGTTPR